jgi:sugar phosphate isomerase/epimerase
MGYQGVAITPDVGQLDLYHLDAREVDRVRSTAETHGLSLAIETGARFLMDPLRKHRPTLLEDDPQGRLRRIDFLRRSIVLARDLGASVVSFWSGAAPEGGPAAEERSSEDRRAEELWSRLAAGVGEVLAIADQHQVSAAFEPEPGMFVERPSGYRELVRRLGPVGQRLRLCLDIGHLLVTGDTPVADRIAELAPALGHVHLDDIRGGVHEHLPLGSGVLDLPSTLKAIVQAGYDGMVALELSRDSHRGARAAQDSIDRVRAALA